MLMGMQFGPAMFGAEHSSGLMTGCRRLVFLWPVQLRIVRMRDPCYGVPI